MVKGNKQSGHPRLVVAQGRFLLYAKQKVNTMQILYQSDRHMVYRNMYWYSANLWSYLIHKSITLEVKCLLPGSAYTTYSPWCTITAQYTSHTHVANTCRFSNRRRSYQRPTFHFVILSKLLKCSPVKQSNHSLIWLDWKQLPFKAAVHKPWVTTHNKVKKPFRHYKLSLSITPINIQSIMYVKRWFII